MDYRKLSPDLSVALDDAQGRTDPLPVFIEAAAPLEPDQAATLRSLGAATARSVDRVVTADLRPAQLDAVSELTWVRAVTLARNRRPA